MAATEVSAINLKILSPSPEVENGISFTDLPASTTVRELRVRIQDAVPSKPAPERMRLIYRGRVVVNDADTLGGVFGADAIRESKDQSLHLVLREIPPSGTTASSSVPRSSTAPPNPFRPDQAAMPASPSLQTNPFRAIPQPRPNSQPQPVPHHHHHHPHAHHHHLIPGPPNPFQIPLPSALQQQMAQQQMAQQQIAQTIAMSRNRQANAGQEAAANPPSSTETEQPGRQSPTVANDRQVPPMGLPPLPGIGLQNLPANGRAVRQEGVGPNGERWTVTYSSSNIPIAAPPPQQQNPASHTFNLPPFFGPSPRPTDVPSRSFIDPRDTMVDHVRDLIAEARREIENATILLRAPVLLGTQDESSSATATLPTWRFARAWRYLDTISPMLHLVERGMRVLETDAASAGNPETGVLRQSANQLRTDYNDLHRTLHAHTSNFNPATVQSSLSVPAGAPEELFLLSSPQGPVGILFNQQGTYMTAPMASSLPYQTFTDQFARNRQIISGLGQHIARASPLQAVPTPTQPPNANNQATPQPHAQVQQEGQIQNQDQNQNQNQNQDANQAANPPDNNERLNNIAGHLWLLFKLACFVYFFSGGGGWYKSVVLGVIAGGVYLAQLGIFDEQLNLIRRHFEAILPVGALAERAARPRNAEGQAHGTAAGRNLTPEEAARRLLQQHQNRRFGMLREFLHTVERSFAIFIASLWPGIGERMVHAQEERVRAERAAEEERRAQAEEAQRQSEEEKRKEEAGESSTTGEPASSSKGKERAAVAPDEPTTSSPELVGQQDDD